MGALQQALAALAGGSAGAVVTWDPLNKFSTQVLSNGNLSAQDTDGNGSTWETVAATSPASGKMYFEATLNSGTAYGVGLVATGVSLAVDFIPTSYFVWIGANGQVFFNGVLVATTTTFGAGDVIGVAFDATSGKVWAAKNNTWILSGNPAAGTSPIGSGLSGSLLPSLTGLNNTAGVWTGRFKAAHFTYSPPTGFSPWGI